MFPIVLKAPRLAEHVRLMLYDRRKVFCARYQECLDSVVGSLGVREDESHTWVCPLNCEGFIKESLTSAAITAEANRCVELLRNVFMGQGR